MPTFELDLKPKKTAKSKKKGLKYLSNDKEELLQAIVQELRTTLPPTAEAPEEKIIIPTGPDVSVTYDSVELCAWGHALACE